MEKLGDDELGHVLTRVVDRQERLACSEVCRQWKRVEGITRTSLRVLEAESLRSFLPRFPNLAAIGLGKKVTNAELGFVARTCPYLRTINLNPRRASLVGSEETEGWGQGDVDDEGLCALAAGCRHLRKVALGKRKGIGAVGVAALVESAQDLAILDLPWCSKIDDRALEAIASASSLQEVNFRGCTSITNQGLGVLASGSASRTLRKLDLSLCDRISDRGVSQLRRVRLEELNLSECGPGITDAAGVCIAGIHSLRKLDLSWLINLTDATLVALSENCGRLEELDITGCELVTGAGVRAFAGHGTLVSLAMAACFGVSSNAVLEVVLRCVSMRYLALDRGMRDWMSAVVRNRICSRCRVRWL